MYTNVHVLGKLPNFIQDVTLYSNGNRKTFIITGDVGYNGS